MDHPISLSQEIAKLLESDPIAASQVKEHLPQDRLIELLGIDPHEGSQMIDQDEALAYVVKTYTQSQILRACRG